METSLRHRMALPGLFVIILIGVFAVLALQPTAAQAAHSTPGANQASHKVINYTGQINGAITDNTYLGTDDQGYSLYYLTIKATLTSQSADPPLVVNINVSEGLLPGISTQRQQDILPNGGTVNASGTMRGDATVTNTAGTITLYVANVSGLDISDGSMHFDLEGTGTGKASGGKTSLYLNVSSSDGDTITGQVTGTVDMPQAALDLITSKDPLVGPTMWYLMRASGLAALATLVATVLIGLALRVRLWKERLERWRVYDVHLTVSVLTGVFLGTHLLLVFLDRIVPFSLADMLIPLHDSYQPIWIAAGILGFYLLLVVWGSSLVRSKIGYSLWRQLHPLALLALGLVMLHALFAGTDGPQLWLRIALVLIVLAVIWLAERWKRVKSFEEMQRRRSRRHQQGRGPIAPQATYSSQGYSSKTVVQQTYPPEASPPRRSQR
ncbi:MAG TPA: hypothetical protein VFU32_12765 [Ktedonobacterales bacterium]|nr:hypothetical protein [Ktedonobacterales bacterium]